MKTAKSVSPLGEEARENLINTQIKQTKVSGWLFVIIGAITFVSTVINKALPNVLSTLTGIIVFVLLINFVIQARKTNTLGLKPLDELELAEGYKAKDRAFNFLSGGVLFIAVLVGGDGVKTGIITGLLCMVLGYSWVLLANNKGRIDV